MDHDELRELTGAYALDAVTDDERRELEAHLEGCPACGEEVRSLRAAASELAFTAPERRPPDSLRARVLASIEPAPAVAPMVTPKRSPLGAWWLAAAATIAAVALGLYAVSLRARLDALETELQLARAQANAAQQQLARAETNIRLVNTSTGILASPDVVRVDLKGAGKAAGASGRAFWSPSRGVLFAANGLPALSADRVYQLWIITRDDRRVPAGLLAPDASGQTLILADRNENAPATFAVTEEPAGGVPQPTGAIVLAGTL
jgi:anti-sigma-K factor RskA